MQIALTIAGSDSGGGAGIQADLKAFQRFGVFGTSVITAITAQNTRGVSGWTAVDAHLVRAQLDAVVGDLRPAALKSGMLADERVIGVVAAGIRAHALGPYVLDPVMVATSGDPLLAQGAVTAIVRDLFPLAALVTPNLDEAALLLDAPVTTPDAMAMAARRLVHDLGAGAALVKGGHLPGGDGAQVVDVLYDGTREERWTRPRIVTTSTHGTGCTLSAAITAGLANGVALRDAVDTALAYVHRAIATAPGLGSGHGPLNHLA
jgi:hydroxymethylpyrimidine/phosphomethylpyrimidine kinase